MIQIALVLIAVMMLYIAMFGEDMDSKVFWIWVAVIALVIGLIWLSARRTAQQIPAQGRMIAVYPVYSFPPEQVTLPLTEPLKARLHFPVKVDYIREEN